MDGANCARNSSTSPICFPCWLRGVWEWSEPARWWSCLHWCDIRRNERKQSAVDLLFQRTVHKRTGTKCICLLILASFGVYRHNLFAYILLSMWENALACRGNCAPGVCVCVCVRRSERHRDGERWRLFIFGAIVARALNANQQSSAHRNWCGARTCRRRHSVRMCIGDETRMMGGVSSAFPRICHSNCLHCGFSVFILTHRQHFSKFSGIYLLLFSLWISHARTHLQNLLQTGLLHIRIGIHFVHRFARWIAACRIYIIVMAVIIVIISTIYLFHLVIKQ